MQARFFKHLSYSSKQALKQRAQFRCSSTGIPTAVLRALSRSQNKFTVTQVYILLRTHTHTHAHTQTHTHIHTHTHARTHACTHTHTHTHTCTRTHTHTYIHTLTHTQVPNSGRGLKAVQRIEYGTELFRELPMLSVPSPGHMDTVSHKSKLVHNT